MRFWIRDQIARQLSKISRIISRRWSASNSERAGSLRRCLRGLRYWLTVEALRCTWPSIHSWLMLSRWKWRLLLHLIRSVVSADSLTSSLEFQEMWKRKKHNIRVVEEHLGCMYLLRETRSRMFQVSCPNICWHYLVDQTRLRHVSLSRNSDYILVASGVSSQSSR